VEIVVVIAEMLGLEVRVFSGPKFWHRPQSFGLGLEDLASGIWPRRSFSVVVLASFKLKMHAKVKPNVISQTS